MHNLEELRTARAIELMSQFAERTGIVSDRPARRYLWTDAFAVCNFLGLKERSHDPSYGAYALRLVDQVHHQLGRYRDDDDRTGWISGLRDEDGEAHPTRGGLRIGKRFPERGPNEPFESDLEWDRDGQYFHYLTQWAYALDQLARSTQEATFHVWARELMYTAHRAFSFGPPGRKRMVWKLSTDLSRPLVSSMGQHDPLDGLVTCASLEATSAERGFVVGPNLEPAMADFAEMIDPNGLVTSDPLGLGALLTDACRLIQIESTPHDLITSLFAASARGLREYLRMPDLKAPAFRRLGFRELGLAIGLAGISMLKEDARVNPLDARAKAGIAELTPYLALRDEIESFWMIAEHRRTSAWTEHADINDVMLATSLVPDGFLPLASEQASA